MSQASSDPGGTTADLGWRDGALQLSVELDSAGVPMLTYLGPPSSAPAGPATGHAVGHGDDESVTGLPLVDVVLAGTGSKWSGRRYCESVVGHRMVYAGHRHRDAGAWHELSVVLVDEETGLEATVSYEILGDVGALRARVGLANKGSRLLTVHSVSSLLVGGLAGPDGELADVDLLWAENDWLSEGRWQRRPFRDALPYLDRAAHQSRSRARFALTGAGTWSSGTYLPMGAVVNRHSGYALAWQVEHNGPWHWQVGEHTGKGTGASYLSALGPTSVEHQWSGRLAPGDVFETVPVGAAFSAGGLEGAVAALTAYRRAISRPHPDHERLPVIFNDYMNTLMGEPTTEALLPLVDAAAEVGAEYFCIDAGWYAERGELWWDGVGSWSPSHSRFPNGITEVLDRIRSRGMVPGLWLEPEVVGVRSPIARQLPPEAFFTRDGERVVETGRHQLDMTHPAARAHLDGVVDFVVGTLGVGYLKLDYNIDIAPGTDRDGLHAGAGMLEHNRAVLAWLDGVLQRYPGLTLEHCSSGGLRTDWAFLSRLQVQSTSDQQNPLLYPPVAAAAPLAMLPEQAGVWAYPQPGWSRDLIGFTMCSAMLGRVHLSGHLDAMAPDERRTVAEALDVYKRLRTDLAESVPFWPMGLPRWEDTWVSLGMRGPVSSYVLVWRRAGDVTGSSVEVDSVTLPLALPSARSTVEVLYASSVEETGLRTMDAGLQVTLPRAPMACLLRVGGPRGGPA
jgi:alpha-galactosidase